MLFFPVQKKLTVIIQHGGAVSLALFQSEIHSKKTGSSEVIFGSFQGQTSPLRTDTVYEHFFKLLTAAHTEHSGASFTHIHKGLQKSCSHSICCLSLVTLLLKDVSCHPFVEQKNDIQLQRVQSQATKLAHVNKLPPRLSRDV